jgi:magnesium transporter
MDVLQDAGMAVDPARRDAPFFWLDLTAPGADEVEAVGAMLGFHPLAIEDSLRFGQRPKIDRYDDHTLLVFYGAERPPRPTVELPDDREPQLLELHLYLSERCLVTVHRAPIPELAALREELAGLPPEQGHRAVYRVLDALTDSFFPLLQVTEDEIDELEDEALRRPRDDHLERLAQLRRRLAGLRRVAAPQRDVLAAARPDLEALPGLPPDAHRYYRDVHDHLASIADRVEMARDLLGSTTEIYFSAVSNRLNAIGERLTVVATVLLPLTLITGFFGMNFGWLVNHLTTLADFLIWGIGSMVALGVVTALYLRRRARL